MMRDVVYQKANHHRDQHQKHHRLSSLSSSICAFLLIIATFSSSSTNNNNVVSGFVFKNPLARNNTKNCKLFRLDALDPEKTTKTSITLNNAVGGLTFAGGLMGFVTKGSKPSLIAGSTFGGLLALSAFLSSKKSSSDNKIGNWLGSGVSGMLTYTMGKKFLKSGKFVPAGLIAGLGAVSFVFNVLGAILSKESSGGDDEEKEEADAEPEADTGAETEAAAETEEEAGEDDASE